MITRQELENFLMAPDFVSQMQSFSKQDLEDRLGPDIARMYQYDQKNSYHQHDLLMHTVMTVNGIPLQADEHTSRMMKVSALLHDIGKPDVRTVNERTGNYQFIHHARESVGKAEKFLKELGYPEKERKDILFYVQFHDALNQFRQLEEPVRANTQPMTQENIRKAFLDVLIQDADVPDVAKQAKRLRQEIQQVMLNPNYYKQIKEADDRRILQQLAKEYREREISIREQYDNLILLQEADIQAKARAVHEKDGHILTTEARLATAEALRNEIHKFAPEFDKEMKQFCQNMEKALEMTRGEEEKEPERIKEQDLIKEKEEKEKEEKEKEKRKEQEKTVAEEKNAPFSQEASLENLSKEEKKKEKEKEKEKLREEKKQEEREESESFDSKEEIVGEQQVGDFGADDNFVISQEKVTTKETVSTDKTSQSTPSTSHISEKQSTEQVVEETTEMIENPDNVQKEYLGTIDTPDGPKKVYATAKETSPYIDTKYMEEKERWDTKTASVDAPSKSSTFREKITGKSEEEPER